MSGALALRGLYEEALRHVDGLRGFELLASLSRLHRVQGSEELTVAAEHVAMMLQEAGLETRLELYRGPLGLWQHYGFWEPRGWRLNSAAVEARRSDGSWEVVASSLETPLVAMVHSPPGEVEGPAVYAKPWSGQRGGGVAVTDQPGWEGYYVLTGEQGYEAIIGFHGGPGVRYWGLYPGPFEEPPAAPAASIPLEKALRIIGNRVRVRVDAEYGLPQTPVLRIDVGDGPSRVLLVAHLCHPRPGAHDNASGVAVVAETLLALNALRGRLAEAGVGATALLAPEWTGTAAAITQGLLDTSAVVAALSVDMVAARLVATGGRLRLITPPLPLISLLDPVLDAALAAAEPEAYAGLAPYEWGSDHDVLLGHQVPAGMLNEWPDMFYHSSLDTPDHISPQRIARLAAVLAAATLYTAMEPRRAAEAAKAAARALLARQIIHGGDTEALARLQRQAETNADAAARALVRGEAAPRPAPAVETRPPYSRTYIYKLLRDRELLEDSGLREAARVLATVAAATGSWETATLYYRAMRGQAPPARALEKARLLARAD